MSNFLSDNVTVIVRTVGERTTDLCIELIKKQIAETNIHIISETPFTEAVRKTFEVGLRENRKWTFVVDADVLIRFGAINDIVKVAELLGDEIFDVEGQIIDKFLFNLNPREAGNHLFRTELMLEALRFIPKPEEAIRPETFVKEKMHSMGFPWITTETIIGVHDFEQFYIDIYRKAFIQAKKHFDYVEELLLAWKEKSKKDPDYTVALLGYEHGRAYDGLVSVDAMAECFSSYEYDFSKLGLQEKQPIISDYDSPVASTLGKIQKYLANNVELFIGEHKKNESFSEYIILSDLTFYPLSFNYFTQCVDGADAFIYIGTDDQIYSEYAKRKGLLRAINLVNTDSICDNLSSMPYESAIIIRLSVSYICNNKIEYTKILSELKRFKDVRLFIDTQCMSHSKLREGFLDAIVLEGYDIFKIDDNINQIFKVNVKTVKDADNYYCVRKKQVFSFYYFIHSSGPGGAEMSAYDTVRNLISRYGAVPTIIMPSIGIMTKKYLELGVPVITIDYCWWTTYPYYSLDDLKRSFKNVKDAIGMLEEINFDVVMTQTMVIPWGALTALLLGKHHIWNVREYGEKDHGLNFFYPFDEIIRLIIDFSSYITTCGKSVGDYLFPELDEDKVGVANTRIDVGMMHAQKNRIAEEEDIFNLLLPGTITRSKGQLEAVMAISELVNNRKHHNIRLSIVGGADPLYLEEVNRFIKEQAIEDYVEIIDFSADIQSLYLNSDIVLSCSKMEAFGRVPLEALLLSKPVIASDKGGNREIISSGVNGLLYEQGSHLDLADKIENMIKHPEERNRMANNGPKSVCNKLNGNWADETIQKAAIKLLSAPPAQDEQALLKLLDIVFDTQEAFLQTFFFDTGNGFNSREYIQQPVVLALGEFKTSFVLPAPKSVKALRFDPAEGQVCALKISQLSIKQNHEDRTLSFNELREIITPNGIMKETGEMLFYNTDPQVLIPVEGNIESLTIEGELRLLEIGQFLQEIEQKNQEIEQKNQEIERMLSSKSWKVTAPLRYFYNILRKAGIL